MPRNTETGEMWHYRDIDAMAAACNTTPIFLDADFSKSMVYLKYAGMHGHFL